MVLFLVLFVIFAIITAACWFQGLWSCAINVINLLLAMIIATNFWEPAASAIDGATGNQHTYLLDAPLLWAMFSISYLVLRMITNGISENNVQFIMPVEMAGRSILAIWCGWLFTCFTAFTMLVAPIGASPAGAWANPDAKSFLFLAPERQWLAFAHSRSMGALGRRKFSGAPLHPADAQAKLDAEVFDPMGDFTYKYYARREMAEK